MATMRADIMHNDNCPCAFDVRRCTSSIGMSILCTYIHMHRLDGIVGKSALNRVFGEIPSEGLGHLVLKSGTGGVTPAKIVKEFHLIVPNTYQVCM